MQISGYKSPTPPPPPPKRELEVKPGLGNIADRYNTSRTVGNYTSGLLLGAAKETFTTALQSPRLAWEIAENVVQAETIGPNLKILGVMAAVPGAILSIPCGPFYGAFQGVTAVADARHNHQLDGTRPPLKRDTAIDYARSVTTPADGPEGKEPKTMTGKWIQGLEEFGDRKLQAGEKPYDVPLLSPAFSLVGGVVSGAMSGAAGLVIGLVAGTLTCGKEMLHSVTDEDKTFGARVGQFVAAPLNVVAMPLALGWNGVKEATPRGFVDGWKHGPIKPVVDTGKAIGGLAVSVVKEAWEH
ncbi:hypothetical protein JST97_00705 [bacterium]|nr:hypothetical protein [bacterium]